MTVEDTAELQVYHDHWLRMETRQERPDGTSSVSMDDCLKSSLRMRPDRIIVGEVRGPEAATLLTAMNTGHDGSCGSLHSNTAAETVTRLTSAPMNVPPIMLTGLDLIIMQSRVHKGGKMLRRVTEVAEISGMEGNKPRLNPIWKYDPASDAIVETGVPSKFRETLCSSAGIRASDFEAAIQMREQILLDLQSQGVRSIEQVTKVFQSYYSANR